ncbi:MAG: thioredoxin family protein [Nanoarchaeota archaeon]|nr:thioredoxin family protein [Nanoarchaeota archaeon]
MKKRMMLVIILALAIVLITIAIYNPFRKTSDYLEDKSGELYQTPLAGQTDAYKGYGEECESKNDNCYKPCLKCKECLAIYYFTAESDWCAYCIQLKPFMDEYIKNTRNNVYKFDVDKEENIRTFNLYGGKTVPVIFIVNTCIAELSDPKNPNSEKRWKILAKFVGYDPGISSKLDAKINELGGKGKCVFNTPTYAKDKPCTDPKTKKQGTCNSKGVCVPKKI